MATELNQAYDNLKASIYELAMKRGELETLDRKEFHEQIMVNILEMVSHAREIEFIQYSADVQKKANETKVEGL
jgi:hypothetical protein